MFQWSIFIILGKCCHDFSILSLFCSFLHHYSNNQKNKTKKNLFPTQWVEQKRKNSVNWQRGCWPIGSMSSSSRSSGSFQIENARPFDQLERANRDEEPLTPTHTERMGRKYTHTLSEPQTHERQLKAYFFLSWRK